MNILLAVFFFFFLPLVRYINLIHIISEKMTDSQLQTVRPQCPWVQKKKKKKKILPCHESHECVSDFSVFLFLSPSSPTAVWETATSEHSLHSGAWKGKRRHAGQVRGGAGGLNPGVSINGGCWSGELLREGGERCRLVGGHYDENAGGGREWERQAATKRNSIRNLRTGPWTEEGMTEGDGG